MWVFTIVLFKYGIWSIENPTVVELSEDGTTVRCRICFEASEQNGNKWIKKGSLSAHLSSEIHNTSVNSKLAQQSAQNASAQFLQEDREMEESMDIANAAVYSTVSEVISLPVTASFGCEMWKVARTCAITSQTCYVEVTTRRTWSPPWSMVVPILTESFAKCFPAQALYSP